MSRLLTVLSLFALVAVAVLYFAGLDTYYSLSPQGCRMSWMWPSYVLQSKFDHTWTPLARRYSLWLYREANNRESNELHGAPVLFIPGNAGSSHQVRSIASSAANQYFTSPYEVSPEFYNKGYTGLDFFAVEFNEDLSAFHGPTIDSEIAYASRAIDYVLSQYPPGTSITVMGHSMGGVVATALLPNPNVSAIITMSTPHTLPPVRFDRRIDHIYARNHELLASDKTPVLSICGGAADLMIPSESCILSPSILNYDASLYRRTVFTSALEGCWTGVGHLAMVWCHQVRWRIARAALEIAAVKTPEDRAVVMDRWLRDGYSLPPKSPTEESHLHAGQYHRAPPGQHFLVRDPVGTQFYVLPLPPAEEGETSTKFVLYASQGSISPVSPHRPLKFSATAHLCQGREDLVCSPLVPTTHKLIPSPTSDSPFPVPDEGTDESEGVVLFEADIPFVSGSYVAVRIEDGDKHGWVFAGFAATKPLEFDVGLSSLLLSSVDIALPGGIRNQINLPALPANSLLVYRLTRGYDPESSCMSDTVFLPLLIHSSHPSETHYYPLAPTFPRSILLHSHATAPYISSDHQYGNILTIHSTGECWVNEIQLTVDWWATIGRWGSRYGPAAACWAVGIMAIIMWDVLGLVEGGALVPDMRASLDLFARKRLPWLSLLSYFVSLLPLRVGLWLGNGGNPTFAPLATLLLPITFGLVCVMWWLLSVLLWPFQRILRIISRREDTALRRPTTALLSMAFIFLVIFVLVPWQVAFLGCWLIHFYTCASTLADLSSHPSSPSSVPEAVPLVSMNPTDNDDVSQVNINRECPSQPCRLPLTQQANAHLHLLLFMTWLLPLTAPVLAVWVRTLATAGLTTPFDGDHNFMYVAPFLVLVEVLGGGDASAHVKTLFGSESRTEHVSPRWGMAALAAVAFFAGPRTTYMVFETASAALGWAVMRRIAPMYWGARQS